MSDDRLAAGRAGAGTLGATIMRRLIDCGHRVLVWNRSLAPARAAARRWRHPRRTAAVTRPQP